MKVAVVQTNAGSNKKQNVKRAVDMVARAAGQGAKLIALPEMFNYRGPLTRDNMAAVAEKIPGESTLPFIDLAKKLNVFVLAGSVYERSPEGKKCSNSSVLINSHGKIVAKYRKINLFNAVLGKTVIKESTWLLAGRSLQSAPVEDFKVGLSICYDLRFGELFRKYAKEGVHVICAPAVFTKHTGQAHWEVLVRARAIENLSYVLAPNQAGEDYRGVASYGNSLIVSPWGEIIARASADKEEIIYADINHSAIKEARAVLPGFAKN
jgi:predicted amidohydrolase